MCHTADRKLSVHQRTGVPLVRGLGFFVAFGWCFHVHSHGDLHARIESLTQRLTVEPSNSVLRLERADLLRRDGSFAAARKDVTAILKLRPDWAMGWLQSARIEFDSKNHTAAGNAADCCLQIEPGNADALVIRSRCSAAAGRIENAISLLDKLLAQDTACLPDLYLERAELQSRLGRLESAVASLDDGIKKLGNTPSLAFPALQYQLQSRDYSGAFQRLDQLTGYLPADERQKYKAELLKEMIRAGLDEKTIGNHSTRSTASSVAPTPNGMASRMHEEASIELTSASDAVQPLLLRGPYLQLSSPTNITLHWRTDVATTSRVIYGTNLASLEWTNQNLTLTNEHKVTLTGLQEDTRYYYAVGDADILLTDPDEDHRFLTHPLPGTEKPVRIWVIGDAGTANSDQRAVRDAFQTFNGTNEVHAWLQLGDNAYNNGTDSEYQAAVFNTYSNFLRRWVTWPTLGNHDTAQGTAFVDTYPYFSIFDLPKNGEAGGVPSGTEHYYSFDLGMVHFICLDSMTASRAPDGAMANWLRSDLAVNTNRWTVAYWHHPPYTKGSHDSDVEGELIQLRQNILPVLEAGGVDLVLTGHSHVYERSYLINGHYGLSPTFDTNTMVIQSGNGRETNGVGAYLKPDGMGVVPEGGRGAVYAVAGCSGLNTGGALNHPAMYSSQNTLGSMVLDFASNRLDAIFLPTNGIPSDWFSMVKTAVHPPRLGRLQTGASGQIQFTVWCRQNSTNVIETTSALDGSVEWTALTTNLAAFPAFIYSDTNAPTSPKRFYRVHQE